MRARACATAARTQNRVAARHLECASFFVAHFRVSARALESNFGGDSRSKPCASRAFISPLTRVPLTSLISLAPSSLSSLQKCAPTITLSNFYVARARQPFGTMRRRSPLYLFLLRRASRMYPFARTVLSAFAPYERIKRGAQTRQDECARAARRSPLVGVERARVLSIFSPRVRILFSAKCERFCAEAFFCSSCRRLLPATLATRHRASVRVQKCVRARARARTYNITERPLS